MSFSKTALKFHTPVDSTDPGFAIKSAKIRWISAYVQSRKPWRIWKPIRVSELPKTPEMDQWLVDNSDFVDGDRIRRGDMVLAWAPIEKTIEVKQKAVEQQKINESSIRSKSRQRETGIQTEGADDKF